MVYEACSEMHVKPCAPIACSDGIGTTSEILLRDDVGHNDGIRTSEIHLNDEIDHMDAIRPTTPRGPDGEKPSASHHRALPQSAMGDGAWDSDKLWVPPSSTDEQPNMRYTTSEIAISDEIDCNAM